MFPFDPKPMIANLLADPATFKSAQETIVAWLAQQKITSVILEITPDPAHPEPGFDVEGPYEVSYGPWDFAEYVLDELTDAMKAPRPNGPTGSPMPLYVHLDPRDEEGDPPLYR